MFVVDLKAKWSQWAYMTDAADSGYGVVATVTNPPEARAEARWAERRGWHVKLEGAYSEVEAAESQDDPTGRLEADRSLSERVARQRSSWRPGFLSLFAGACVLESVIRELRLSWVESWDLTMGAMFDLANPTRVSILIKRIRAGCYWCIHLAPPCSSFSRARQPKVRSRQHPWGLPRLRGRAARLVEMGNYLCLVALEILKECLKHGVMFSLENPVSSMMWEFPPMREFVEAHATFRVTMDYCRYGTPWKKPTTFLTNIEELRALGKRCNHRHAHQELRGRDSEGILWTTRACSYPRQLCVEYAEAIRPRAPGLPRGETAPPMEDAAPGPIGSRAPAPLLNEKWTVLERWHLVFAGKWKESEHNNILEARAALAALRHASRSRENWGTRILFFTDSLVTLGCFSKGRSSAHQLLQLCRRVAAIVLSTGIRPAWRYVPSELNFADGPSRQQAVGVAGDTAAAHRWRGFPAALLRFLPRTQANQQEATL